MSDSEPQPAAARLQARLAVMAAVGALAGLAAQALLDFGSSNAAFDDPVRIALTIGIVTLAAALILLQELRRPGAAAAFGLAAGAVFALLTWMRRLADGGDDTFMTGLWLVVGWPLCGFIAFTLAAVAIEQRALRLPYADVFRHAVSGPVAAALGLVTAGATALFLRLWGFAFDMLNVAPLTAALESPWLLLPLAGAAGGAGATFAMQEARLRGAGEAILLIGARILLPMAALFSALFALLLPVTGIEGLRTGFSPAGLLLSIALGAVLVFNGVYRDGERAPGRVLRWPSWAVLAVLPVLTLTALYGVAVRIADNGLTQARVVAGTAALIGSAYALAMLSALVSELPRRRTVARRWMPPVARLNIAFAAAWLAALALMQTPLLDPLAVSARDQARRLETGKVAAADFDFAAMQFRMGAPGRAALERVAALEDHPEAETIRAELARVRSADDYYEAEIAIPPAALPPEAEAGFTAFDGRLTNEAAALEARAAALLPALDALECALRGMEMDAPARERADLMLRTRREALTQISEQLRRAMDPNLAYPTGPISASACPPAPDDPAAADSD